MPSFERKDKTGTNSYGENKSILLKSVQTFYNF